MTSTAFDIQVNPAEETILCGHLTIRFLATGENSNGTIATFELTVPGAEGVPAPHSHDRYEETIYGVAGTLTWTVEGKVLEVGPGQALIIPRGAVHCFANNGSQEAKALCVISPGVLGPDYFREMAAIAAAAGGRPDRAKMVEIMLRHGLTPAPPPSLG